MSDENVQYLCRWSLFSESRYHKSDSKARRIFFVINSLRSTIYILTVVNSTWLLNVDLRWSDIADDLETSKQFIWCFSQVPRSDSPTIYYIQPHSLCSVAIAGLRSHTPVIALNSTTRKIMESSMEDSNYIVLTATPRPAPFLFLVSSQVCRKQVQHKQSQIFSFSQN